MTGRRLGRAATTCLLLAVTLAATGTAAVATPAQDPGTRCLNGALGLVELNHPTPGAGARAVPVVFVHGINTDAEGARWPNPLRTEVEKIPARSAVLHTYAFDYHATSLEWVANKTIGPRLAKALTCLAQDYDLKPIVVAYSMGGLATKFAASLESENGGKVGDHLAEVITIGTPFLGSWLALRMRQVLGAADVYEKVTRFGSPFREVASAQSVLSICTADRTAQLRLPDGGPSTSGEHPCRLAADLFGIPVAPVGAALQVGSKEITDLANDHPWPSRLRVRTIGADIHRPVVKVGFAELPDPTLWRLGDVVVDGESAAAGGANGPGLTLNCEVAGELLAFFSPCFHTALLSNPDVIKDVTAEVAAAAGSSLATAPRPIKDVDWQNHDYTTDCAGNAPKPFPVTAASGKAETRPGAVPGGDEYYDIDVLQVATGDLTGDGRPEAAVLLYCKPEPTSPNFYGVEAQVFTDGPRLLATVKAQDAAPSSNASDSQLTPDLFAIRDGMLTIGADFRIAGECRACDPTHRVLTWTWDAGAQRFKVS